MDADTGKCDITLRMFEESNCPYMSGLEKVRGKRYDFNPGLVYDDSIKGEPILKYNVYFEQ